MFVDISIRADVKAITKKLDNLAYQQVPFATAQALTALAKRVQEGEKENILKVFPTATPFTVKSVGMKPARKSDPTAVVFVRDIQAAYLAPYEFGGMQVLGKKQALLGPRGVKLNQYGNIPKGTLKRLKGRRDVFIGTVKTKNGEISGVWQRTPRSKTGGLNLLIKWAQPIEVRQHLGFRERAEGIVRQNFKKEFGTALARALATAK